MSLREILVYVGTYICQDYINENTFVNSVKNRLESISWDSTDLKYVICTDVRFVHEVDFIKQNSGIMINIIRDDVVQALDIAEHDLDMMDPENFNYIIYNNGTYEELFDEVWKICHSNMEFANYTVPLRGRTHDANTKACEKFVTNIAVNKTIDNTFFSIFLLLSKNLFFPTDF